MQNEYPLKAVVHISATFWLRSVSGFLFGIPDGLPAHPRRHNLHVADFYRVDGKDIVTEQHHVGELAGGDRAFFFFLKFNVGGTHGVGLDSFTNRELLLGKPAAWIP